MTLEELIDCNQICNGMKSPCNNFSKKEIKEIKKLLPKMREKIAEIFAKENYKDTLFPLVLKYRMCRGCRFSDDEDIIWRMQSALDKADIYKDNLEKFCLDALVDAMQADYWYTYEKDYGHD